VKTPDYKFKLKLRDNTINFRKWKVKDRKKFIDSLRNEDNIDERKISESLVYDCIDNDIVLSSDEFRYVLTKIREESIGDTVDFNFTCSKCKEDFTVTYKLDDILKPEYKEYSDIIIDDINIEIGDISLKKEFYDKYISECENMSEIYFIDFLAHIKSINSDTSKSFNELTEYFEDLDTDIFDQILDKWEEMRFKINDKNEVTCSHCGFKEDYIFDDIPDFFPKKWFIR